MRPRALRLRAPLLLGLWIALGIEATGGLLIFCARLVAGTTPGVALHVALGVVLAVLYAVYQFGHWRRVSPLRSRLDYVLGLIAAFAMVCTNATGLWLGWLWWNGRASAAGVEYPPLLSAAHTILTMVVLTFVAAHLGAVLMRDRAGSC